MLHANEDKLQSAASANAVGVMVQKILHILVLSNQFCPEKISVSTACWIIQTAVETSLDYVTNVVCFLYTQRSVNSTPFATLQVLFPY